MTNVFDSSENQKINDRINILTVNSKALWGTMDVAKMLAHCNVTYEMALESKYTKPTGFKKFLLKLFVKSAVVNDKPYTKNGRTGPDFIINSDKDFESEKTRLLNYVNKVYNLGESYFENRDSHSFGKLTIQEWNNMFYKHLNHHLNQFGV